LAYRAQCIIKVEGGGGGVEASGSCGFEANKEQVINIKRDALPVVSDACSREDHIAEQQASP
jgi:hypothetical protein